MGRGLNAAGDVYKRQGLSRATDPTRSSVTTDELDKTSEVSVEMLAESSSTTTVSYTHLDVYKRQALPI